jgi:hypothetical protein
MNLNHCTPYSTAEFPCCSPNLFSYWLEQRDIKATNHFCIAAKLEEEGQETAKANMMEAASTTTL